MAISPPTGGFADAGAITNVRMVADGEVVHGSLMLDSVLRAYLEDVWYQNGFFDAASIDLGAGIGGLWADSYDSILSLPIVWLSPDFRQNRMSQLIGSRSGLFLDCDGSLANVNWAYGRVPPVEGSFYDTYVRSLGADPNTITWQRDVTPAQINRRPSLQAVPFKLIRAGNLALAGRLNNNLGAAQVFSKKPAVR
jgi:hypothetical protein